MSIRIGIGIKPSSVSGYSWDASATALLNRMIAAGETQTDARARNINDTIIALKAANLFDTRFDGMGITRATGLGSSKLNWVQNAFNLTKGGAGTLTFTTDGGYNSDGSTTYLKTNFIPSVNGSKFKQNDASFWFLISGSLGSGVMGHGVDDGGARKIVIGAIIGSNDLNKLNSATSSGVGARYAIGYNCMARTNATTQDKYINANAYNNAANSTGLPVSEIYLLAYNDAGTPSYFVPERLEAWGYGAYITQAEFLTIQGIVNAYIAAL
jgi:hypothetical protein